MKRGRKMPINAEISIQVNDQDYNFSKKLPGIPPIGAKLDVLEELKAFGFEFEDFVEITDIYVFTDKIMISVEPIEVKISE